MNSQSVKIRGTYENGVVIPTKTPDFKVREVFVEFVPQGVPSASAIKDMAVIDSQSWDTAKNLVFDTRRQLVGAKFPFLFKK